MIRKQITFVRNRESGVYAALIMAALVFITIFPSLAPAETLCKEDLGEYYVNIGLAHDGYGTGLDDAFEVIIRRMRPSSEQDLERLKSFNYFDGKDEKGESYSDGRKYMWLKEGKEYRLFRKVGGRKDVRIDIFVVTFSPGNKMKNMMRLMNANRGLYNELGLESRLQVLGVMGVAFRGRHGKVEFINNLKADPGPAKSARAYVSNADTMLYRYARDAGYEGADPTTLAADWVGPSALRTLLRKNDEQSILDNLSNFAGKQGYYEDLTKAMSTFGNITVNGLGADEIKYIFLKCVPNGTGAYGPPRSAFVPLKVTDGSSSYYPVFIFPSAFSSGGMFNSEIWKSALEISWWNAAANLDVGVTEQKKLREAILRYDLPHLKLDFFNRADPKSWVAEETDEYSVHSSLKSLLKESLKIAIKEPEGPRAIPWMITPALVKAEPAQTMVSKKAENEYNEFLTELVPDLGWYMKQKTGIDGAIDKVKKVKSKIKSKKKITKKLAANIAAAIADGYIVTAAERTSALKATLEAPAPYFEYLKSWKEIPEGAERSSALVLLDKIKDKGYSFDDLAWLNELSQNSPMPEKSLKDQKIGERIKYLVDKNFKLNNLDKVLSDPHMFIPHRDKKEIDDLIDTTIEKGKTAANGLNAKTDKEVKDRIKKKEAIAAITQELKILKGSLAGAFKAKTDAETAAQNAISPKETAYDSSYDDMIAACKGDNFSPSRRGPDDALYRDIYNAYLFNQDKLVACTPKAKAFVEARQEYRDVIEEQDRNVAVKAKPVHELDDQADDLFEKMARLIQLDDKAKIEDGFARRTMNKALIAVGIKEPVKAATSWKELIKRAFGQYLTGGGTKKEDALAILDTHLKRVPGLEVVYDK